MLTAGKIIHFRDLFHFIPKTIVARDMGINNVRFTRLIEETEEFTLKDLLQLSALMEMKPISLVKLALDQHEGRKKTKTPTTSE